MHAQLTITAAAKPIQGIMVCQRGADLHVTGKRAVLKSMRPQDLMAVEVDRLLEDVRMAFDRDLSTATRAAGRLAALLGSKLPRQIAAGPARGGLAPWQKCKVRNYIEDHLQGPILIKDLAKLFAEVGDAIEPRKLETFQAILRKIQQRLERRVCAAHGSALPGLSSPQQGRQGWDGNM